MNTHLPVIIENVQPKSRDSDVPSALERMRYLCPSRYFRFFMFHEPKAKRTCWLPEGYDL